MQQQQHKTRGFTLVELGVVLGALAILASSVTIGSGFKRVGVLFKTVETFESIQAAISYLQVRQVVRMPAQTTQRGGMQLLRSRDLLPGTNTEDLQITSDVRITGIQMSPGNPPQPLYKIWVEADNELIADLREQYAENPRYLTNATFMGCQTNDYSRQPNISDPFCFAYTGGGSVALGCQSAQSTLWCWMVGLFLPFILRRKRSRART